MLTRDQSDCDPVLHLSELMEALDYTNSKAGLCSGLFGTAQQEFSFYGLIGLIKHKQLIDYICSISVEQMVTKIKATTSVCARKRSEILRENTQEKFLLEDKKKINNVLAFCNQLYFYQNIENYKTWLPKDMNFFNPIVTLSQYLRPTEMLKQKTPVAFKGWIGIYDKAELASYLELFFNAVKNCNYNFVLALDSINHRIGLFVDGKNQAWFLGNNGIYKLLPTTNFNLTAELIFDSFYDVGEKIIFTTEFSTNKKYKEALQEILEKVKKEAIFQLLHKITSERCQYQTKKFHANLLLVAVKNQYFDEVLEGLSFVEDVNQADATFGFTLLHCASRYNRIDIVKKLLEKNANVNAVDYDGWTALHLVAEQGHDKIFRKLLKKGANIKYVNKEADNILHIAAQCGQETILNLLIQYAQANDIKLLNVINQANKDAQTPLHIAAMHGHDSLVQILLEQGTDVNTVDSDGWSVLHLVAQEGHITILNLLIQYLKAKSIMLLNTLINQANKEGITPLCIAIFNGHDNICQALLEQAADVNVADSDGWTALHLAAQGGHEKIFIELLKKVADINAVDLDGWTALHLAAQQGQGKMIAKLLEEGTNVKHVNKSGSNVLHIAIEHGHMTILELLIQYAQVKDVNLLNALINQANKEGITPLRIAILNGHANICQALLKQGADINEIDAAGRNVLHSAAQHGHITILNAFIQYLKAKDMKQLNILINQVDNGGITPLHIAVCNDHISSCQTLLAQDADVNAAAINGWTALHMGSQKSHPEILIKLLERGANINYINKSGCNALHIAATHGHTSALKLLIQYAQAKGIKWLNIINQVNEDGETPLHLAAFYGHNSILQILLEQGTPVNTADTDGWTPLHIAAQKGHDKIFRKLLEKGANIKLVNKEGDNILHIAAEYSQETILDLLIQYAQANDINLLNVINQANEDAETPLHIAAMHGHNSLVQILLEQGADINQVNKNGMSALHWACQNGHINLVKLLLIYDANITQKVITNQKTLYEIGIEKNIESRIQSFILTQNRKNYFRSFFITIKFQLTPAELAALMGHKKIAKLITQWHNTPDKISSFTI